MTMRCPNCGAPWVSNKNTCNSCGATFISRHVRRPATRAAGRAMERATGRGVLASLLGQLSVASVMLAWSLALVLALIATLSGGAGGARITTLFLRQLAGGYPPLAAWAGVALGLAAIVTMRGRGAGWVGVVAGGLLLLLALP